MTPEKHAPDASTTASVENVRTASDHAKVWMTHELARSALESMVSIGDRHGIEILPVKGVVTARTLYADVVERPMQDVDVRVTRAGLRELRRLAQHDLDRFGLRVLHDSRAYENIVFDMGGIMLEVEARVGPPGVCSITIDQMLTRATGSMKTFGFACLEPELHDHALVLAVNAFKDKMVEAAPWALRDLDLVVMQEGFSPARFAELARSGKTATLVWVVADYMLRRSNARGAADVALQKELEARWTAIRAALGDPPRAAYGRWMAGAFGAAGAKTPGFLERNALRVGARASSDSALGCGRALAGALWRTAETALGLGIELK